ncbi:MAG: tungstate ABC transporter substrate-binding protein WtpA [Candidatus Saliniplasma sp.]
MKKILAIICILILASAFFAGCTENEKETLKVYHAGSLSIPFDEMKKKFEEEHPDVEVRNEGAGSVATIRKVTDQGKKPDVVAVADYTLIPDMMYDGDKADWTVRFAKNRMVMAYTEHSNYNDEIDTDNWYDVLDRTDVKYGFSNPNDDPCGYRSQMVTLLAESHYGDDTIFERLTEDHTGITAEGNNISVPSSLDGTIDTSEVMIRSAEVDLMGALEAGEIDYLYIYQSVAEQHEGVEYIQLPEAIDLSSVEYAENYGKVTLTRGSGDKSVGKPIVYGITIPSTVSEKELAVEYVKMLIDETGQDILTNKGQPSIVPAKTDNMQEVPSQLKELVEED